MNENANEEKRLRPTLKDMIVKYEKLSEYIRYKDFTSFQLFQDFIEDLKILDKICIDRNRY